MENKKRGNSHRADLDLIRSVALLFVISVHRVGYTDFYVLTDESIELFILHFIRSITITCVPLFLILSGYLCGDRHYIFDFSYVKKLATLFMVYLICGIICVLPHVSHEKISTIVVSFFEFKAAPYAWYLAMYIGLFLLIPFLNTSWEAINNMGGVNSFYVF